MGEYMGSSTMAVYKILAVLGVVVADTSVWANPQRTSTSTTPVPILRYIDRQNTDGSYTFGFEGADGTYKLETRHPDGRVKGKYGYFDPEGNFREAAYGAEAGRGFEPKIDGINLPPPTINAVDNLQTNVIPQSALDGLQQQSGRIKIVNGRRAILKKRLRV